MTSLNTGSAALPPVSIPSSVRLSSNPVRTFDAAATVPRNLLARDPINGSITITGGALVGRALTMTNTNVNGVCALVDQAKAGSSCKNDDDDKDRDHEHHKHHKDHKDDKDHKERKDDKD
jgi:hypothetical protein